MFPIIPIGAAIFSALFAYGELSSSDEPEAAGSASPAGNPAAASQSISPGDPRAPAMAAAAQGSNASPPVPAKDLIGKFVF